ncbi:hypothetical protein ACL02U_29735 [Streptomyces sp. MS06]|uniref:hypothetical protein n=1 Tax=Streptomyces sp. MS06 TaxID=3385974 RepID=UPI0039A2D6C0
MTDFGGDPATGQRRSKLADYAEMTRRPQGVRPAPAPQEPTGPPGADPARGAEARAAGPQQLLLATPPHSEAVGAFDAEAEARGREFADALEDFRDTAVLLPLRDGGWLTADFGGVRWILAFTDETALARYALARGEGGEEWAYETVLGARLLDVAVPGAGVVCGVALDAADGAERALLLPPVAGIVPDACAVDRGFTGGATATADDGERTR